MPASLRLGEGTLETLLVKTLAFCQAVVLVEYSQYRDWRGFNEQGFLRTGVSNLGACQPTATGHRTLETLPVKTLAFCQAVVLVE